MDRLLQLPEELLQDVLARLRQSDLLALNLASKSCYQAATPLIWKDVNLIDCRRSRLGEGVEWTDEHDDTKIIGKLLIILGNKRIATSVQTVNHRCHLPPPSMFDKLPNYPFSAQTLSTDPRTIKLVQLAVREMTNVHTLRIILGHPTLTDALLRCFFDIRRTTIKGIVPVKRLWLENCRVSAGLNPKIASHPYSLPLTLSFDGLKSIRFRRLPLHPGVPFHQRQPFGQSVYTRHGPHVSMGDGSGSMFATPLNDHVTESRPGEDYIMWLNDELEPMNGVNGSGGRDPRSPLQTFYQVVHRLDDRIYEELSKEFELPPAVIAASMPHDRRSLCAYRGSWLDPEDLKTTDAVPAWKRMQREQLPSTQVATLALQSASATLTSLTFDWVLTADYPYKWPEITPRRARLFIDLFQCRFPFLRAFQYRSPVTPETLVPAGIYLLDRWNVTYFAEPGVIAALQESLAEGSTGLYGLEFLEAHPKLQCLGWPTHHFFAETTPEWKVRERAKAVIARLGANLVDLRIDTPYRTEGDRMSEKITPSDPHEIRSSFYRRRRFIAEFAPYMTQLRSIKIEGAMPRDERREVLRALHACSLEKIVMIGMSSPIGNSWGPDGRDLHAGLASFRFGHYMLEGENAPVVRSFRNKEPTPLGPDFEFTPEYGWGGEPMVYTLACYHAATVRELKFCGYRGAALSFAPRPEITNDLLAPLRHFHELRTLILSLTLPTLFEGDQQEESVLEYWRSARDPSSVALVRAGVSDDDEPEGWERELRTKFAPPALAWHVTNLLAPHLSEKAKRRKGGLAVRASFCIGREGGIFDLDLRIGKGAVGSDVCLGFEGPREELEPARRRGKLVNRRWF